MALHRYMPQGEPLAIAPEAVGAMFESPTIADPTVGAGGAAVVAIRGPLDHRRSAYRDSYEAIRERVAKAIDDGASRVVLDIDSPGGLAAGCFDCARDLRRMASEAGVELFAYVGGHATSAAYALASAASRIGVSSSATLGSIGVLGGILDATKALGAMGIDYRLIGSGARKGDGHPAKRIDEAAVAATSAVINGLATEFFELIASHGWGGSVDAIRALEAGVVLGREAVERGLASEISTLEAMTGGVAAQKEDPTMKRSAALVALATSLGLDAECSDAELVDAIHSKLRPSADLEQLRQRAEAAEAELAANRASAHAEAADAAIDAAVAAGKIAPAARGYHRATCETPEGLERFRAFVAGAPTVVDGDPDDNDSPTATAGGLTAEEKRIAAALGLTDEEFAASAA